MPQGVSPPCGAGLGAQAPMLLQVPHCCPESGSSSAVSRPSGCLQPPFLPKDPCPASPLGTPLAPWAAVLWVPWPHATPVCLQMKRKSENGLDSRALSPGKKLCKGSEYGRTLGPCIPSPTTTFGDLRNAKPGQGRRRRIPSVAPPPELQDWLRTFQVGDWLLPISTAGTPSTGPVVPPVSRALWAQTESMVLAEDNLLWREKCREEGIEEPLNLRKRRLLSPGFMYSPWKFAFMRQHKIDMNWRSGELRAPKVRTGLHPLQRLERRAGSPPVAPLSSVLLSAVCLQTLVVTRVWSSSNEGNIVIRRSPRPDAEVWNAWTTGRVCEKHAVGHTLSLITVPPPGLPAGGAALGVGPWMSLSLSGQFDGTHIVSGSLDTSIRVWDMESGNCLHTLMGHQSLTSGMELRDNILVSGNADSTVKIWDIKTGQCLQTLQGEWDRVGQGPALYSASAWATLCLAFPPGPSKHQSAVTCLQFSSKFVVTSSDDGTVKLWDLKTGEFVRNLVALESGGSGGVVWRIRASNTKLVCAVGSRNGTEETKLLVLDFDVDLK
uniref:F-box/WD repeat-containing protein 7 n=1 Tax=Chelonoidis abingdonii TaxID=106734 RepID=A0A8C0GVD4_CHEAB